MLFIRIDELTPMTKFNRLHNCADAVLSFAWLVSRLNIS